MCFQRKHTSEYIEIKIQQEQIDLPWWLDFEFFKYFWIEKRKHYHFLKCKDVMAQSPYTIKTHLGKKAKSILAMAFHKKNFTYKPVRLEKELQIAMHSSKNIKIEDVSSIKKLRKLILSYPGD